MDEDFEKMAIKEEFLARSRELQVKYLEKDEVYKLFMSITGRNYRDKALFDLIYRHGLRRIEATWLKKDWVHNGRIWIRRAKNGISQEYNLHPASEKLLELYDRNPGISKIPAPAPRNPPLWRQRLEKIPAAEGLSAPAKACGEQGLDDGIACHRIE